MTPSTLAAALEHEHQEIDAGIEQFLAARADGGDQAEPLRRAMDALRRHIFLEEELLFPPLRVQLVAPIFVMLREHGEIWDTMDTIELGLTGDPAAGPTAELCRMLLAQLELHNAKEEVIVYPQADTGLDASAETLLRTSIETGQLPPGWVCARAGTQAPGGQTTIAPLPGSEATR